MTATERLRHVLARTVMGGLAAWERAESGVSWNMMAPGFLEDPHSVYRALRENDPVHRSRQVRGWLFTRYDDVLALFRDARLSANFINQAGFDRMKKAQLKAGRTEEELMRPTMLNSDPPRHTRLRGLVSKAFTPRAIRALEGRMEQIVGQMLDATAGKSEFDVIDALAYPLPVIIIAELLGVPSEDRGRFRHWSDEAVRGLGVATLDDMRASIQAGRELTAYLEPIAEARRLEPRDDLLSGLLQAEEAGDRLTMEDSEMSRSCESGIRPRPQIGSAVVLRSSGLMRLHSRVGQAYPQPPYHALQAGLVWRYAGPSPKEGAPCSQTSYTRQTGPSP